MNFRIQPGGGGKCNHVRRSKSNRRRQGIQWLAQESCHFLPKGREWPIHSAEDKKGEKCLAVSFLFFFLFTENVSSCTKRTLFLLKDTSYSKCQAVILEFSGHECTEWNNVWKIYFWTATGGQFTHSDWHVGETVAKWIKAASCLGWSSCTSALPRARLPYRTIFTELL